MLMEALTFSRIALWLLCALATFFSATRFALRTSKKGKLAEGDYLLAAALLMIYTGAGLTQSILGDLYHVDSAGSSAARGPVLTAAFEMFWIAIYLVKFCFLAQFKFHKPPYAYVSVYLTRLYWISVAVCTTASIFAIVQPIVLCPRQESCLYLTNSSTAGWEMAVTIVDIVTDLLVISIPICLIHMANFTRSYTIVNASFKGLSIFCIAIAATRLALQYDSASHRINYVTLLFWLILEASVAVIVASISSYRLVVIDFLAERKSMQHFSVEPQAFWRWPNGLRGWGSKHNAAEQANPPTSNQV